MNEELKAKDDEILELFKRCNKKDKEIERLKEEYIMLQNASDEVEEKLQQRINKAIHRIQLIQMDGEVSIRDLTELVNILKGSDKE